jgi:small subunit ribosomal protein S2
VAEVGIAELLEAGVHFGHQTRRWNPKMRRFIFGERNGIYIIDLLKTQTLLAQAQEFAGALAHRGGTVLFVGTKKQARDTIKDVAEAADMPYVNHRWLGGLLTNFQTINQRIRRLHDLERYEAEGQLELLPTRERMAALADLAKLRANLGGVKNMQRVPDAMFVIDLKTEEIAVKEARRLRIPIIGLVDTNCDPDGIDFVVPGNDDAIRSCALITQAIGQVVSEGHSIFRAEEERARKEAEERARAEAEARAKREAEEQAKREAEEQVKREAEEQARKEAEDKAAAEAAAAATAAQQQPAESTPVSAPVDPQTLQPGQESPTPMRAGADARQPAKQQEAPAETIAESAEAAPAAEPADAAPGTAEEPPAEAAAEPPAEAAAEPPAEAPAEPQPEPQAPVEPGADAAVESPAADAAQSPPDAAETQTPEAVAAAAETEPTTAEGE